MSCLCQAKHSGEWSASSIQSKILWNYEFALSGTRHLLLLSEAGGRGAAGNNGKLPGGEQKKQVTPGGVYKGTHKGKLGASAILHQSKVTEAAAGAE